MSVSLPRLGAKLSRPTRGRRGAAVLTALVACTAVTGGAVSSAPPASAAATATISRPMGLAAQSFGTAGNPSGTGNNALRKIYLASGDYTYGYTFTLTGQYATTVQDSRVLYIAAGWYYWRCVIGGTGGTWPSQDNYETMCELFPVNGSSPTAYVPAKAYPLGNDQDVWDMPPGTWQWTGYLTPHF